MGIYTIIIMVMLSIKMKIWISVLLLVSFNASAETDKEAQLRDLLDKSISTIPKSYPIEEMDEGDIKAIFYETLVYKGKETRAFAYIGIPKSDKPVPAMVLIHGNGGRAFHEWVRIWNDLGYAAISMSLEGYMPSGEANGKKKHNHSGPSRAGLFRDAGLPLEEQWMTHALSNTILANSLLKSLPEVDAERIGIVGISWGAVVSSFVSGVDSRFKCAISVFGAGFLSESHGTFGGRGGRGGINTEEQKFWDPATQLTKSSIPTLWVNSNKDVHFSVNITSRSFEATKENSRILINPDLQHGHVGGWDPDILPEIYVFAEQTLKGGYPELGRIIKQPTSRDVKLEYETAEVIEDATIYYLNEALTYYEAKGQYRQPEKWLTQSADIGPSVNTVTATLPDSCMTYFVNLTDSNGHIISSTLVELAK